ncbi:MAG: hypothetical protein QM765_26210 [Myxococcales bacterium]
MTGFEHFNLTVIRHGRLAMLALSTGFVFALLMGIMVAFVVLQALGLAPDAALLSTGALALLALGFGTVALASSASAPCRFELGPDGIRQTFLRSGRSVLIPWDAVVSVKTERLSTRAGDQYDELTVEVREGAGRSLVLQERPSDGAQIAAFRRFREAVLSGRNRAALPPDAPRG